jgi:hypothetical protein
MASPKSRIKQNYGYWFINIRDVEFNAVARAILRRIAKTLAEI